MTFLELAYQTLAKLNRPLTLSEIWEESERLGFQSECASKGETPIKTLAAKLYTDMRDNPNTEIIQVSKRPATFCLKGRQSTAVDETEPPKKESFLERDLHPLLSFFVYGDSHFRCMTKTIHHEKSRKKRKGVNEWLHPDLVGIYFPYDDFDACVIELMDSFTDCQYKLFSFEMKISVTFSNLREYYFQAVSNSSWANEGYLAALNYSDDPELQEELLRLNNAFGIGLIKLNPESVEQSEILYPAKYRETIDWDTVDRLAAQNPEFKKFMNSTISDIKGRKIHPGEYDELFADTKMADYIKEKKIH